MATEFPILQIVEHGRDGQVIYRDSAGELSFYWEFGGNNVLALINVGTAAEWSRRSPWAVARRGEILRFVADEVARQKAPNAPVKVDDAAGVIYLFERGVPAAPVASAAAPPKNYLWHILIGMAVVVGLFIAAILISQRAHAFIATQDDPVAPSLRTGQQVATLLARSNPICLRCTATRPRTATA